MIMHLATGDLVICEIIGFSSRLIVVRTPLEIFSEHDERGAVESFSLQPYLQPFSKFGKDLQYNFNINQVVSVSQPHETMYETYYNALSQMFSDEVEAAASQEEADAGPDEEKPEQPVISHKVVKRILH